jgi:hypothetical protein
MASMRILTLAFAALLALSARATAQATAGASASLTVPPPRTQVVSIQPLNAVLDILAVEYEHALSETVTLGVGTTVWGSYLCNCDLSYFSGDLKLRYYPGAKPLEGFSVGMSVGATTVVQSANNGVAGASATGATVGTLLEYAWLVPPRKNFYVAVGAGAKALFIGQHAFSRDLTLRYPTARVSIGWAF